MAQATTFQTPTIVAERPPYARGVGYIPGGTLNNVVTGTAVAGLTVQEFGEGAVRQTLFTFTAMSQSWLSGTAASQFIATKIYTLPSAAITILGATSLLTTTASGGGNIISTATLAYAFGTVATADDTHSVATNKNIIPSTSYGAMVAYVTPTKGSLLAAPIIIDGTTTASDVYLNHAIAADAGITAADTSTTTGWMMMTWLHGGDY